MRKNQVLFVIVFIKILLHYFIVNNIYELHRDEFLHLDQAKHLDWGYLSVPPFSSWISYIMLQLGADVFWIRFFPALFGAMTIVFAWKLVEELKGGWYALLLTAFSLLFSVLLRINILWHPNSADIMFWTAALYCIVKYFNTSRPAWLYWCALAFGVGIMNKYNIIFLVLGLLPAVLLSDARRIFLKKELYIATGIVVLLILPNLLWQYSHGFPVVHHMSQLADRQLVNVSRLGFLKEQLLYFMGALPVLVAAFVGLIKSAELRRVRFLAMSFFFTLAVFMIFRAKAYYAIGLYPAYIAVGAVYLETKLRKRSFRVVKAIIMTLPLMVMTLIADVVFPTSTPEAIAKNPDAYQKLGMLRWEDGQDHEIPQDFADMLGWKELASISDRAIEEIGDPQNTIILTDNYGQAGSINYYSRLKVKAVSLNADYINWFDLSRPIRHVVLVQEAGDTDKARERERMLFSEVRYIGSITNQYAREKGTSVYILKNATADINKILADEIEAEAFK